MKKRVSKFEIMKVYIASWTFEPSSIEGECFPNNFIQDMFDDICNTDPPGVQICPGFLLHSAGSSLMEGHTRSGKYFTP